MNPAGASTEVLTINGQPIGPETRRVLAMTPEQQREYVTRILARSHNPDSQDSQTQVRINETVAGAGRTARSDRFGSRLDRFKPM